MRVSQAQALTRFGLLRNARSNDTRLLVKPIERGDPQRQCEALVQARLRGADEPVMRALLELPARA